MTPQPDIPSGAAWTECTPSTAANFSAVAYFFGRAIEQSKKVPIGLIDSTWGGTPADSWVSMDTLGESPALWSAFHSRALFADGESRRQELAAIQKREAAAKGTGDAAVRVPTDQLSWSPSGLYNGMIAPLTPYSIKGFLWYQGETNSRADRYRDYQALFRALIVDWRTRFRQGDLPFLFAQISSFHSPEEHWGIVRDAQRRALQLRNTAMVVTIDVGESHNVHPADKQTVGARFALAARGLVYREGMSYTSPEMRQVTSYPEGLQVWFDHAKGLASHGPLTSFEIAGENHVFVPAEAKVEGETVTVSAATILFPVYVRYAWANDDKGSLYNAAGLPVGTFTSENTPQE
jgi:sialate O-acetylesterase